MKQHRDRSFKFGLLVALVLLLAGIAVALMSLSTTPSADVDTNFAMVKVVVNDEVGVPLDAASIQVTSDQTNQTTTITAKDSSGAYAAKVRPGTYVINAQSTSYTADSQPLKVSKGDTQELSFYLSKQ